MSDLTVAISLLVGSLIAYGLVAVATSVYLFLWPIDKALRKPIGER